MMLTERQAEILAYIREQCLGGRPPTLREIGAQFGITSPNGVEAHLRALRNKGALAPAPDGRSEARAIRLAVEEIEITALDGLLVVRTTGPVRMSKAEIMLLIRQTEKKGGA
jgi:SOS-response transcriptional repressor LexA